MLERFDRKNNKNSFFMLATEDNNFNNQEIEEGVYLVETKEDKAGNEKIYMSLISSVIYISEKLSSENKNVFNVVLFDGAIVKTKQILPEFLYSATTSNNEAFSWLLNNGLKIHTPRFSLLKEYLICSEENATIKKATEFNGWTKINGKWQYIANGFSTCDIEYVGDSRVAKFETKGDKKEYYQFLRDMFIQHPIVLGITAYSNTGFISPHLKEDNNQILALTGLSSKGKSTVLKIALSTWTAGENFISMNATQHGITHTLRSYQHNNIAFDETGEKTIEKPERIESFIYSLASGKERLKMKRVGKDFETEMPKRMYYSFLICGEVSIINGIKVKEGIEARLCELVLNKKNRIFNFPEDEDDKTLSGYVEEFNRFIQENYGHLATDLLPLIKENIDQLPEKYSTWLDKFRSTYNFESSIANRKLKIMATISVSAELILDCVLIEDTDKELKESILYEMQQDMINALFNDIVELEDKDTYKSALNNFEDTLAGYFIEKRNGIEIDKEDQRINLKAIWGEVDISHTYKKILISASSINEVVVKLGLDRKLFIDYLKENNLIEIGKDGKAQKLVTRQGQTKRYYSLAIPMTYFEEKIISQKLLKEENKEIEEYDQENPFEKEEDNS